MQTYINPFEQSNDHMRIMHYTQFRSSFKNKTPICEQIRVREKSILTNEKKLLVFEVKTINFL